MAHDTPDDPTLRLILDVLYAGDIPVPRPRETVTPSMSLTRDLGLASIQVILLISQVEQRLDVTFDYEDFKPEYLASLERFAAYLNEKLQR